MFKPYSVKLTIEGLYGAFAEKYSFTIADAHHVHRLLQALGANAAAGPVQIAAPGHEQTPFQPFDLFSRFIQYLRKIAATQPDRRFFLGVRFEPSEGEPGPWNDTLEGQTPEGRAFSIEAWGTRARVTFADTEGEEGVVDITNEEPVVFAAEGGRFVCNHGTFKVLFKDTFARLVEMCEESIAKNAQLFANEVPHQAGSGGSGLPEFT